MIRMYVRCMYGRIVYKLRLLKSKYKIIFDTASILNLNKIKLLIYSSRIKNFKKCYKLIRSLENTDNIPDKTLRLIAAIKYLSNKTIDNYMIDNSLDYCDRLKINNYYIEIIHNINQI